ncbi:MAG TPA: patatin-like phospholipase family protein [Nitrospirota bacterium]|nr:patatin-like phospholipase family protein [Nitrospirota bacterium]
MKKITLLSIVITMSVLASCAAPKAPLVTELPKPKIALVLGGGAARGFAHVGVIRALEQEKIPIDMIIGTSVGSLIGAIYANNPNSFELEWTAFTLEKDSLFDYGILNALTSMGMAKGDKLEEFVRTKIATTNIENLKLPFAAVATDLNRGTRVVLDRGSVAKAVHASSAVPGVFAPVDYEGRLLVDGGVLDNIPIDVAREKGADIVIAVDISENVVNYNITNLVDVMLQAVNIMFSENVKYKEKEADVLIAPAVGNVAMLDFSQKKRCMQAGIDAVQMAVPEIKRKIEEWTKKKQSREKTP